MPVCGGGSSSAMSAVQCVLLACVARLHKWYLLADTGLTRSVPCDASSSR